MRQVAGPFSAARALAATATLAGVGVVLAAWSMFTPWGVPCLWHKLTGLLCPFCGSTTLVKRLLVGDVRGAWAANQLVFVAGCGLAVASVFWVVELAGGPHVRLPKALRDQRVWYVVVGVCCLAFAVWRNVM